MMGVARRTLIRMEAHSLSGFKVTIPAWDNEVIVDIPIDLVPQALRDGIIENGYVIAYVNIDADLPEDLTFRDFEPAPTPVPEEDI
jgi:hypothetical protein